MTFRGVTPIQLVPIMQKSSLRRHFKWNSWNAHLWWQVLNSFFSVEGGPRGIFMPNTDTDWPRKCPRYIGNVIIYWVKPVMGKSWRGVVFLCFCLPFLFPPIYSSTLQCHNIVQEVCGCPRNQASKEAQCQSSRLLPVWLHILVFLQSGVEFFTCSLCATEYRKMWELQVWVQNSFDRFDLQKRFRFLIPAFLRRLEQHIKDDMSDHPLTYTKM